MFVEPDLEFENVTLQRWMEEQRKRDVRTLRAAWNAIARSHALLDKEVLSPGSLTPRRKNGEG